MGVEKRFDLIVIGGGHAGIEAAWMAAQEGLGVAIVTMPGVAIASAPCNPSIGGVGKGQVVREVDALGGLMGRLADLAAIQWRTLNTSKGYAVQSTRVQIDKMRYPQYAEQMLLSCKNISLIREKVEGVAKGENFFTISTAKSSLLSSKVVVTTGTFLGGKLHVGRECREGGRPHCEASPGIENLFDNVETLNHRFKTGTPPRLDRKTIDFSKLKPQLSDKKVQTFHYAHSTHERFLKQAPCYLTKTNRKTIEIVQKNKLLSPMFSGQIQAVGARYCPGLEDKVHRYPDRYSHHIFLEPETLGGDSIYPSGISSSLPKEVQLSFVRTIEGLEKAHILAYGQAVEYDVVNTARLDETLQYQDIEGLYFAGQVNGTSGYEEAAGQGLVAGVNAALAFLGKEKLTLSREDSYIGVMIEDLISTKRDSPYRLFTARCENRLSVREDNAIIRMAPYRIKMGLDTKIDRYQREFLASYHRIYQEVLHRRYGEKDRNDFEKWHYGPLRSGMNLGELLKRNNLDPVETLKRELRPLGQILDERVLSALAISICYEGHIQRADKENARFVKLSHKKIDWKKIATSSHIAHECRERIREIRPSTFSQLQRIDGIRAATLAYVAGAIL